MKTDFMEHIKLHWLPELRKSGFKGSGRDFRRVKGVFAHCINIQPSRDGTSCCMNLGVEPKLQPIRGFSEEPDFSKIKEIDCELRARLTPSDTDTDWWWQFGDSEEESIQSANSVIQVWNARGELFFDDYINLPGRFSSISVSDYEKECLPKFSLTFIPATKHRAILLCARIFLETKDYKRAREFSEYGIKISSGSWLELTYEDIIKRCRDSSNPPQSGEGL